MSKLSVFLGLSSLAILILSYLSYKEVEYFENIFLKEEKYQSKCLDGSPYNFYFKRGKNEGKDKYLIFFEGGAWCGYNGDDVIKSCVSRSETMLGTSNLFLNKLSFFPFLTRYFKILSSSEEKNPEFHNWNKIVLRYCDGVGFIGNTDKPVNITNYDGKGKNKILYFRGMQNVLETLNFLRKNDKLNTNFYHAKELVLSGSSAGGQAVLTYSNFIKKHFEHIGNYNVKLYAIADSGVFLNHYNFESQKFLQRKMWLELANYIENNEIIKDYCDFTLTSQASNFTNCFFADHFIDKIKIPVLLLQSVYDSYAIKRVIGIDCFINKLYSNGKLEGCPEDLIAEIDDYKTKLILKLSKLNSNFVNFYMPDCVGHNYLSWSNAYDLPLINENIKDLKEINNKDSDIIKSPRDAVKKFIDYYGSQYYKINRNTNTTIELADEGTLKPIRIISGNEANKSHLPVCSQVRDIYNYIIYYGLEDFVIDGKWKA